MTSPRQRPFTQVDVFTHQAYMGNPLAVVLDGTDLSDAQMQSFARWTNVSETAFLLPPTKPEAHYRVRIFTPANELPFAGHPTLGSCHAWLHSAGAQHLGDDIVQECAVGLVRLRRTGKRLAFAAPPLKRSTPEPTILRKVCEALGVRQEQLLGAQLLNNGPTWLGLLLDSRETVLDLEPNLNLLADIVSGVGVAAVESAQTATPLIARKNREARAFGTSSQAAAPAGPEPTVEVRFFAPGIGVGEDPITGSFNASLAQWLIADGLAPSSYVAAQGRCIGRDGQVFIDQDREGQVWVGGEAVSCIQGQVLI
jgi:PhzF family phenazine biosynthesis protein